MDSLKVYFIANRKFNVAALAIHYSRLSLRESNVTFAERKTTMEQKLRELIGLRTYLLKRSFTFENQPAGLTAESLIVFVRSAILDATVDSFPAAELVAACSSVLPW